MDIARIIAEELSIGKEQADQVIRLLDEGNTIPFIARYRKEMTRGMDDTSLRAFEERLTYLRGLEERKQEVLRLIGEQGKLTPELESQIGEATILQRVEDLYKPFKKKRLTRAAKAKARGLDPLAGMLLAQRSGAPLLQEAAAFISEEVPTAEDAVAGACDIVAEIAADDPEMTGRIRTRTEKTATIAVTAGEEDEQGTYDNYKDFEQALSKIPGHRILAINRGEKEKKLKVSVRADEAMMEEILEKRFLKRGSTDAALMEDTLQDAYKRLIAPSIEREMRNMLTEKAQEEAIKVFGRNTESLLMVPPVRGARIVSIDPGYRTGCKVAVLDETGKLLDHTTIYPTQPRRDLAGSEKVLESLCAKYDINTIVIGNGTGGRETEEFVAGYIRRSGRNIRYTIVNEAGASVYSASKLAAEEYPDLDVTTRGAMSLGRRLQDPLAELVKIPIKSIGVGQYQHDMDQKKLEKELHDVVEACVNSVGVDLNTASPSLLKYVAGINEAVAKSIVAYREENGRFTSRRQLLKVPRLGARAYEQCAGFLRIAGGTEVLDATGIHPESYEAAKKVLAGLGLDLADIGNTGRCREAVRALRKDRRAMQRMAEETGVGGFTLEDILSEIEKPGRDPRDDAPEVVFRRDVTSMEDLQPGMELTGTVRNVVDFGAFVDIGVKTDGLVHISQLADRFIRHPLDVVAVGDTVKVRILDIDHKKGRISLTMKGVAQPGNRAKKR
ncbi:MAG: RNA-binding transcriptional accessory protein [Clostridiales bacterium]|nr:RNA-binding transcriptional accessory protein [Clostridiales bacterium]